MDKTNLMQQYYEAQPSALLQIEQTFPAAVSSHLTSLSIQNLQRLVLLGIGSSYHSVNMAAAFLQSILERPVDVLTPEQVPQHLPYYGKDTLVIAASQSGTSSNTLKAVQALHAQGCITSVITQGLTSPIAQAVDLVFPLCIPEEKAGPKTMGVTGTVATFYLLASLLRPERLPLAEAARTLRETAGILEENLQKTRDWVQENADVLCASPAWIVVGQKAAFTPAGESALKLVETVRTVTACYELEEIVHGPYASFRSKPTLLCLTLPTDDTIRPTALCDACDAEGGHALRITLHDAAPESHGFRLTLRRDPSDLGLLQLLLPAQAISAWIAPRLGIDLDAHTQNQYTRILAGHLDA